MFLGSKSCTLCYHFIYDSLKTNHFILMTLIVHHIFCEWDWNKKNIWHKNVPLANSCFLRGFMTGTIYPQSSWTWQVMGFLSAYYYSWDVSHIFPHFSIDLQGDIFTHYGDSYVVTTTHSKESVTTYMLD